MPAAWKLAGQEQPRGRRGGGDGSSSSSVTASVSILGCCPNIRTVQRGDDDVRGPSSGLGLGLAISRSLAEAVGGRLTASSSGRGHGSTFRLELKVVPQVAEPGCPKRTQKGAPSPVAPGRNDLRLLLVEDNNDTLRYLAAALRKRGHEVVTADCYRAALAALERGSGSPSTCSSRTSNCPMATASSSCERSRRPQQMAGIAMSGFGAEEDLRHSREAGFFDHLTKPIDLTGLDNAIKRAVASVAGRDPVADDESETFSLRTDGNSSGAFKIVWSVEPKAGMKLRRVALRPPAPPLVYPHWEGQPLRDAHPGRFVAQPPCSARCLARHWLGSYRSAADAE